MGDLPVMPKQFTEVGATVAILPYSMQHENVQFAKIVKVTKTQVTVEYTNPVTAETTTKRFLNPKYGAYYSTKEFPRLDEYGAPYRSTKLVLKDDPDVARYIAGRAEHIRAFALRRVAEGFAAGPTVDRAKSLIAKLEEFITISEGQSE